MDERVNQPSSTTSTTTNNSALSFKFSDSSDQRERDIVDPPPKAFDRDSYLNERKMGLLARSRISDEYNKPLEALTLMDSRNEDLALGEEWVVDELERARD